MSLLQLAKNSILHFSQLKEAKKMGFGKIVVYLLILSLVSAIPITVQVLKIFSNIRTDSQEIAQKIPDFTIEDGKLQANKAKGFIYQTDSIIFTFDPEGKRSEQDIAEDQKGNILSVGLLADELVLSLPGTSTIMATDPIEMSYQDEPLDDLTGKELKSELSQAKLPWWSFLIILLVSVYPSFLNLIMVLLITTIIGNFYSRIRKTMNGFMDNLKIMISCATLPIIISSIIALLAPDFDTTMFIALLTFFIFTQTFKQSKE